jgi:hypothetical protein
VSQLDPEPFRDLFGSEPADPKSPDAARWIKIYEGLVAMMERQLSETRAFALRSPGAMQEYLGRENIAILEDEIAAFKIRLEQWKGGEGPPL